MCSTILCDYKRVILWFDLLKRFVYWNCGNVILTWTPNILQFGWRMDQRPLKQNYNESLATSLLEILCSSRSSCSFFLKVYGGSSSVLWRLEFIEFLWFVVCWGFWRLLSLIPVNFKIKEYDVDDSSSNVLCIRRFVLEVLQGFGGLNLLSFTNLWFLGVSGGF